MKLFLPQLIQIAQKDRLTLNQLTLLLEGSVGGFTRNDLLTVGTRIRRDSEIFLPSVLSRTITELQTRGLMVSTPGSGGSGTVYSLSPAVFAPVQYTPAQQRLILSMAAAHTLTRASLLVALQLLVLGRPATLRYLAQVLTISPSYLSSHGVVDRLLALGLALAVPVGPGTAVTPADPPGISALELDLAWDSGAVCRFL